jgi:hypothetical protein
MDAPSSPPTQRSPPGRGGQVQPPNSRGATLAEDGEQTASGPVRLSVNLSAEAAEFVRSMTAERGITITEAIRRALSTQKYVEEARRRGARIFIEEPGQPRTELVFTI